LGNNLNNINLGSFMKKILCVLTIAFALAVSMAVVTTASAVPAKPACADGDENCGPKSK
jgi:hypothetical protein